MAVDTQNKRASAINVGQPWRGMLPQPDAVFTGGDRSQLAFLYRWDAYQGGPLFGIWGDAPAISIHTEDRTISIHDEPRTISIARESKYIDQ